MQFGDWPTFAGNVSPVSSCRSCARLLELLNRESGQRWEVDIHLFHAKTEVPRRRAEEAKGYGTAQFGVTISYYDVTDLLVEDKPGLLGLRQYPVGSGVVSQWFVEEGQILYCDEHTVTLYQTAPIDEVMIAIVAKELALELQTSPDLMPVDPETWSATRLRK
jgi:hypothetical protein